MAVGLCRDVDRYQQLIALSILVPDAIRLPEVVDGQPSRAARRRELELGPDAHQCRSRVVGGCCNALASALDDVAFSTVLLQAVPEGLPPEVGLVVPLAARVEHDVATEGAHGPELRSGDQGGGLGQSRCAGLYVLVRSEGLEGDRGSDPETTALDRRDAPEGLHVCEGDDDLGLEQPVLHVRDQIGPSGDDHRLLAVLGKERDDLVDALRLLELELGEPEHQPWPSMATVRPPPAPASRCSRSAERTLPGVKGRSRRRMPTAS